MKTPKKKPKPTVCEWGPLYLGFWVSACGDGMHVRPSSIGITTCETCSKKIKEKKS